MRPVLTHSDPPEDWQQHYQSVLLSAIVEGTTDAIFVKDLQGRYRFINGYGAQCMRRSVDQVIGRDDRDFWDPESAELLMQRDAEVMRSGQVSTSQEKLSIEGETRVYSATKAPLRDHSGAVIGILGISRDITMLSTIEEQLRERVHQLNCLHRVSELLNRSELPEDQLWPAALQELVNHWCHSQPIAASLVLDTQEYATHAGPFAGASSASDILLGDSVVGRLTISYRDAGPGEFSAEDLRLLHTLSSQISDRIRRERTLRHLRLMQALVHNSTDWIVVADMDLIVRYSNPTVRSLLGRERHEVMDQPLETFLCEEERSTLRRLLGHTAPPQSSSFRFSTRARHRNGSERHLEGHVSNHFSDPAIRGYLISLRDVTDMRSAEAALRASEQQLRESQRLDMIGRLAGGIAHDYNNILTAIGGTAELALLDLPPEHPLHSELSDIQAAVRRAAELTQQLLAFSRRQVVQPTAVSISAAVTESERMLRRLIGEDITLVTRHDGSADTLWIDPGQLHQVILNLVVNARDAMPEGGKLTLDSGRTQLQQPLQHLRGTVPAGDYTYLQVQDEGTGIPESVLPNIFDPFFTTKEAGKGTGLGLSTVYGIVTHAGGSIVVDTQPGRGTTFTLYFPVHIPSVPLRSPSTPAVQRVPSETVLLVEDEEPVRKLLCRTLNRAGYQVLCAPNGLEALNMIAEYEGALDLLVTDVVMPGLNGRELVEALHPLYPSLKVLYVSGYTEDEVLKRGVREGEVQFLQKPFGGQRLLSKIAELLQD